MSVPVSQLRNDRLTPRSCTKEVAKKVARIDLDRQRFDALLAEMERDYNRDPVDRCAVLHRLTAQR